MMGEGAFRSRESKSVPPRAAGTNQLVQSQTPDSPAVCACEKNHRGWSNVDNWHRQGVSESMTI